MLKRICLCSAVIWSLAIAAPVPAGDIAGKVTGVKDLDNAVIYVEKIPNKVFEPPKEHAVMNQHNLKFIPHVLPVLVGTTIEFHNADDVLHNVFSPSSAAKKLNLGSWGKGVVKTFTFQTPGEVVLLCNVHPEMEGYVVVLDTSYFARCNPTGEYRIPGIPAGSYTFKCWHPKLKGCSKQTTVPEAGVVTLDFTMSK